MRVDPSLFERYRKAFAEVLAEGTNEERRAFARVFVKKVEVDPGTGDILMHLFSRPPALAQERTPASEKTGVRIGLVAGAGFGADWDKAPVLTAHWQYSGVRHGTRQMQRVGIAA